MPTAVIRAEGLSKRYHRGLQTESGLRHALEGFVRTLGVASLSWRFLERPLIRRGHGYSYGEHIVESAGAPPSGLEGGDFSSPGVVRP